MACDDPEFNGKKPFDILMSDLESNTTTKAHSDMLHLNAQKMIRHGFERRGRNNEDFGQQILFVK